MKRLVKLLTIIFMVLSVSLILIHNQVRSSFLLSLTITCCTCFYHFFMRLVVGTCYDLALDNKVNYNRWWFKEHKGEKNFYQLIKVKRWKNKMPTYNPSSFDLKKHSLEEIIMTMTQAELVHETIFILSYLPILAGVVLDNLTPFVITSILASLIDLMFVFMQRFNRPRLIKLMKREEKTKASISC